MGVPVILEIAIKAGASRVAPTHTIAPTAAVIKAGFLENKQKLKHPLKNSMYFHMEFFNLMPCLANQCVSSGTAPRERSIYSLLQFLRSPTSTYRVTDEAEWWVRPEPCHSNIRERKN